MVEQLLKPFLKRYPRYESIEHFTETFFRVIRRAMEFQRSFKRPGRMDTSSREIWAMALFDGYDSSHPLLYDSRLVCGVLLALFDAGLIEHQDMKYVIEDHPTVSLSYWERWIIPEVHDVMKEQDKRYEKAVQQERERRFECINKKRPLGSTRRISGL